MPVYPALHSQADFQAHQVFKQRGVLSHTSGVLKDLYVQAIPLQPQIAYGGYAQNIAFFVAATNTHTRLSVNGVGSVLDYSRPLIGLPLPHMVMIPKVRQSALEEQQFVEKLDRYVPSTSKLGKVTRIYLERPTFNIAESLTSGATDFVACAQGELMPADFIHLRTLMLVATEFLRTHTYPAFSSAQPIEGVQDGSRKLSSLVDFNSFVRNTSQRFTELRRKVEQTRRIEETGETESEVLPWPDYDFSSYHPGMAYIDSDQVLMAKPSPAPLNINIGPVSDVPGNFDGTLFPYFQYMNTPDKVTLRRLFLKHFFRILGHDEAACKARWIEMRAALDRISSTSAGMALAHIYYGMDLALASQTRMYVIKEGREYLGFVLLGYRYLIYDGKDFIRPTSREELNVELSELSSHDAAIASIATLLSRVELTVPTPFGRTETVLATGISTSRQLVDEIVKRTWQTADKDAMVPLTQHLRYEDAYLTNTPDNLLWVIEEITRRADLPIERDVCMYIPANIDLLKDKLFRVLAAYGPDAPSMFNTKGTDVYRLPPLLLADGEKVRELQSEELPPKLHVNFKPLQVAYNDWLHIRKTKELCMHFAERGAGSRGMVVTASHKVTDVFFGMCIWANKDKTGAKRTREDDEDAMDAAPSNKKIKPSVTTAAELLALISDEDDEYY